jgi:hypothetical protein
MLARVFLLPTAAVRRAAALVALLVAVVAAPAPASAARWDAPVDGAIVRGFAVGARPYAAGQHRGIDLATRPGAPVRAACAGRVTFAGTVPGRGGGVTVACGRLAATHLGLASLRVRRDAAVVAGSRLGVARGGHVQLGARRLGERHGYVDPAGLLGGTGPPPLGPAPPAGRRPRGAPPRAAPPRLRPAPAPAVRPRPVAAPAPARPPGVPAVVWAGLALVAAGLPLGAVTAARRRPVAGARLASEPAADPG